MKMVRYHTQTCSSHFRAGVLSFLASCSLCTKFHAVVEEGIELTWRHKLVHVSASLLKILLDYMLDFSLGARHVDVARECLSGVSSAHLVTHEANRVK